MGRRDRNNRRNRQKSAWSTQRPEQKPVAHVHFNPETPAAAAERENAIREFKARETICPECGKPIEDMASAIADKDTGAPMHFDCVLKKIEAKESVGQNQNIAYIGNGRFAVVTRENPNDPKSFKIERTIDWEDKNKESPWRGEMADLYSKVR